MVKIRKARCCQRTACSPNRLHDTLEGAEPFLHSVDLAKTFIYTSAGVDLGRINNGIVFSTHAALDRSTQGQLVEAHGQADKEKQGQDCADRTLSPCIVVHGRGQGCLWPLGAPWRPLGLFRRLDWFVGGAKADGTRCASLLHNGRRRKGLGCWCESTRHVFSCSDWEPTQSSQLITWLIELISKVPTSRYTYASAPTHMRRNGSVSSLRYAMQSCITSFCGSQLSNGMPQAPRGVVSKQVYGDGIFKCQLIKTRSRTR